MELTELKFHSNKEGLKEGLNRDYYRDSTEERQGTVRRGDRVTKKELSERDVGRFFLFCFVQIILSWILDEDPSDLIL